MKDEQFQIRRERLADQISDKVIQMIRDGDLKPGDKLPSEPELMKMFDVGRSSIREAIGALSLIGLIRVRPGQGTHVAVPSEDSQLQSVGLMLAVGRDKIRELVEARAELEKATARIAAESATGSEIDEIQHHHEALRKSLTSPRKTIMADLAFHMAIAKACHNSILFRFLSELRTPMQHWMEQRAKHDRGYDNVYEQHDLILNAIRARDGNKAQAAMEHHLISAGEKLLAVVLKGRWARKTEAGKEHAKSKGNVKHV